MYVYAYAYTYFPHGARGAWFAQAENWRGDATAAGMDVSRSQ